MDDMKCRIKNCCLEKEVPCCVSDCPFHFDMREFISRVQRGSFNLAYRLYANAVGFPFIVSSLCDAPCSKSCVRKNLGGAVELKLLEKASVKYAANVKPNNYNMPLKDQKVAVIGGGISGLACALRLCGRKYQVTVFEQSGRLGGELWSLMEPRIFLEDIERQFMNEEYDLRLNTKVTNIETIAEEFDAVYLATGRGGDAFGFALPEKGAAVAALSQEKIFAGGMLLGVSPTEAIAQGLEAAQVIEFYLKTAIMNGGEAYVPTRIKQDIAAVDCIAPVAAAQPGDYTKEEAAKEAGRCLRCRCEACVKHCDMMTYFQKFPKLIEQDVHITIHPGTLDGNGTVATRLISTCNQCGLCAEVCPEDIDVGLFMRESHRAMREKDAMPWAFHEFWLRDMEFTNSKRAALTYCPPNFAKHRYLFFPGCQTGASDPQYVLKPYAFLAEKMPDTALMLRCCGAPALWSGDAEIYKNECETIRSVWEDAGRPEFIFACSTCRELFAEYLPEIHGHLLYDILADLGFTAETQSAGEKVSVFDPCSSRKYPYSQNNVRQIVSACGYDIVPLEGEGKLAKCCSWGGQISIANPPYAELVVNRRISANEYPYVTYCTNCRDIFAEAGKNVCHILDIIFSTGGWGRKAPTFSKRRANREYLKDEITQKYLQEESKGVKMARLLMTNEMEEKLHKQKILEEDVMEVIDFCERSGRKIISPDNGHFTGYSEIGHMTCWVEYEHSGEGYILHNAYSHRMKIELEEVWNGRKQKTDL